MLGSFRARLIATVIALVAVTAVAFAITSFVLVRNSLRGQLIDDAVARAEFNITVLASVDQLSAGADRESFTASGLADRFLFRGTGGVYVEFPEGDPFSSSLGLVTAGDNLSGELRDIVTNGNFGYEFLSIDTQPMLVVGGRRPPAGPDFYFFDSAADVENALDRLAGVLAFTGVGILALGALGAGVIARRVLRPVAIAGEAAGVMAAGDLSVRLPAGTTDELGRLAVAFNQMAASLERQIEALVEAHDREKRFVADVSHELRTPLTALVNEAARLRDRFDELPDTDRRVGEMLVWDVGRLSALVEDLLEVSRLDYSSGDPDMSPVDLSRFLAAVIADRHPAASLQVTASVGSVVADRRSLERIVGNLLDNARAHAPAAPVSVTARMSSGEVLVAVADEGPGVPADELSRLFDRFYKADSSRQGGSGLGLAIAHKHAERIGGELTVHLGDRRGLVFVLRFPVTESLHSGDLAEKAVLHPEDSENHHPRSTS